jgi:4-aminobutyrate aminotransferase
MMYAALRRGLNFKVSKGNVLTFAPPLNVAEEELDQAWGILQAALVEISGAVASSTGQEAPVVTEL